jgi:uncharacterized protein
MSVQPSIIDFRHAVNGETSAPAPDRLLQGSPRQTVWNHFAEPTGRFFSGIWESTPGKWRVQYTEHEFCHLLSGRLTIVADDGATYHYGPGDSFVIPAGFNGSWEVLETARKLYSIYEPK